MSSEALDLRTCRACGRPLKLYSGRGRPSEYCGNTCRKLVDRVSQIEGILTELPMSLRCAKLWRSRLVALSNMVPRKEPTDLWGSQP